MLRAVRGGKPDLNAALGRFYGEAVGPYGPPERRLVEEGYRSLPFPFAEVAAPAFEMRGGLTLAGLAGHLGAWSAVKRCREATGRDPLPEFLRGVGNSPERVYAVCRPIALRVGRVSS